MAGGTKNERDHGTISLSQNIQKSCWSADTGEHQDFVKILSRGETIFMYHTYVKVTWEGFDFILSQYNEEKSF